MFEEKLIKTKKIHNGMFLTFTQDLIELSDGTTGIREFVSTNDGCAVVAVDSLKNLILVQQFRYAHKTTLLELPAGAMEKNEEPIDAAKRELFEETGFKSKDWQNLGTILPSTYATQKTHIFLAKNAQQVSDPTPDEGEILKTHIIPFDEVLNMILKNEIKDSKTIIGVLKTFVVQHVHQPI